MTDIQTRLREINRLYEKATVTPPTLDSTKAVFAFDNAVTDAWPDIADEIARLEKANKALRDLWEKNKVRHTKDGCSCRFEENGDLLESCKFHGDDKTKADALAEAAKKHLMGKATDTELFDAIEAYGGDGK